MIQFKKVTKTFQGKNTVHALGGIDLEIPRGDIFGVIGQSGAGKSTLIRCINMLEKPDSGEVWVDGIRMNDLDPRELREARKKTGMIFQHFNLLNSRTVRQNIAFPLELAGTSKNEIQKRVKELAELVGLADKLDSYPQQLSGGQKQRVGIARALSTNPKLLLCDEATSALDPETTTSVLGLLKTINERLGLTIVLITHEMTVIQEICDRVAVLEGGILQEAGPVVDVFTRPKSKAARRMLQGFLAPKFDAELDMADSGNTRLRLTFINNKAHQPLISQMIRLTEIDVNILFGRIDQMKATPFGMLMVELGGNPEQVAEAIRFLENQEVGVEVI